ncbi:hypothetical protein [Rhodococcus spongiicola]|uniref:hypothetical protein n=1 Tax=Rhodococcus spongiicola TaxID=2487352 RepID=UPI0019D41738|nr:hypothetical protein [Rhodococcus spongiicola]
MKRPVATGTGARALVILVAEVFGAALALALAFVCWTRGVTTVEFAPIAPGTPPFTSVRYSGGWISAAFALLVVAGLLVLAVLRRYARRSSSGKYP